MTSPTPRSQQADPLARPSAPAQLPAALEGPQSPAVRKWGPNFRPNELPFEVRLYGSHLYLYVVIGGVALAIGSEKYLGWDAYKVIWLFGAALLILGASGYPRLWFLLLRDQRPLRSFKTEEGVQRFLLVSALCCLALAFLFD